MPDAIEEQIEQNTYNGSVFHTGFPILNSASLLAEESNSPVSSIGESRITQNSSSNSRIIDSPRKVDRGFAKINTSQISSIQTGFTTKLGSLHTGISQIDTNQSTILETRPSKISSSEIGIVQPTTLQNGTSQVSSAQVSSIPFGFSQVGITEIDPTQVTISEIGSIQINPTKISFSSSISSEQFFSIHNSTPKITNRLNNNATNIWSDLLQTEIQLDIETENGTTKFIGDDFEAVLDGEHLDKQAHPYDLLNTHLAPGIRKLPSELDVEILQALIAAEFEKNGSNPAGDELLAKLTSNPLLAIANGDFEISDTTSDTFAWDTHGASNIENGQAVLTEDSPFLSNFTQTFTVPQKAKTVQFKLIGAELGASEFAPPDAFEVALLDANTNESLVSDNDLTATDSLLNIQNDGTAYFSDKVRISGATSGEIIELNKSQTVTVDISDLTPGTEATLYFDLLGFGDVDSRVVIDDVRLSDQNLLRPIAIGDTATTNQGQPVIIDILANDRDDDGTIAVNSVQIATEPNNGFVIPRGDGTVFLIWWAMINS